MRITLSQQTRKSTDKFGGATSAYDSLKYIIRCSG